jgi:AcrR family transcriptional regulator
MRRRDELAAAATDYALEHGLVGLSLRPLAEALGTSDRMLVYHFGTKDELVATILRTSNDRSVEHILALPPSSGVREAVLDLWQAMTSTSIAECSRLYVEASALGLFGRDPYAEVIREFNTLWMGTLAGHLVASGVRAELAPRVTRLVDAVFVGLLMDRPLEDAAAQQAAVDDLAAAATLIAGNELRDLGVQLS